MFIDAVYFRDENIVKKLAAYVMLDENGRKEVLNVGQNESSKYWVLNELKNRGVDDIFILCADAGMKVKTAFPKTEYQRCLVHQMRYSLDKDKKDFAKKSIYQAADEETGWFQKVKEKYSML